jgi:hypothetical protein
MRTRHVGKLLAVVLLGLTACGSESDDDGVASLSEDAGNGSGDDAQTPEELEAELQTYAECLRDQGIEVADPVVTEDGEVEWEPIDDGAGPGGREALSAAMDECGTPPVDLRGGGSGEGMSEEAQQAMLEYAQCMRDNGVEDFPDPDTSGEGAPFPDSIDRESPEFEEAHEACQDLLASARDQAGDGDGDGTEPGTEGAG